MAAGEVQPEIGGDMELKVITGSIRKAFENEYVRLAAAAIAGFVVGFIVG